MVVPFVGVATAPVPSRPDYPGTAPGNGQPTGGGRGSHGARSIGRGGAPPRPPELCDRAAMTDLTRTDRSRRALQITLGTLSAIPFASGLAGMLTGTVVLGGLARLLAWRASGRPHPTMVGAVVLELVGVPAVAVWQARVARRAGTA